MVGDLDDRAYCEEDGGFFGGLGDGMICRATVGRESGGEPPHSKGGLDQV